MSKMNTETKALATLLHLYSIHSPSGSEKPMRQFIERTLQSLGIKYSKDDEGQIWHITENQPLLCAHMDQVQKSAPTIEAIENIGGRISADGFGLGADDKNGIWVILQILRDCLSRKLPIPSFIFSVDEERISGKATKCFEKHFLNKENKPKVPFAIVLDRRNSGDIIGRSNGYCTREFEDRVTTIGKPFGYKPTMGAYSDADGLSRFVNAVNLSVGYYNPHSTTEYTVWSELLNALEFTKELVLDPANVANLASQPFNACPSLDWEDDDEIYDFSHGWRGGKRGRKSKKTDSINLGYDRWSRGYNELWLLDEEKEYLNTMLFDRLTEIEVELNEYWEGNLEEDPEKIAKLESERLRIEGIMSAMY